MVKSNYHVPGINIYPSHPDPGAVQIPIGRNSGSLPDLSSFQFTSPLPTPLDQDDTQHSSNPSYSNSPKGSTSPSTLSPTSIPSRSHQARFSFGNSPPHESPGPPLHFSPVSPLSPNTPNNHHHHHHHNHQYPQHNHFRTNHQHLSVPVPNSTPLNNTTSSQLVNRFHPSVKGLIIDSSGGDSTYRTHQSQHQHQSQFIYQVPSPQPPSPCPSSPQSIPNHVNSTSNSLGPYRGGVGQTSPRPSPQSSPGLTVQQFSPLGSPDPAPSPHNYNCFVEHFEQFTMGDNSPSPNHHIDYTQLGSLNNTYQPVHIKTEECNTELTGDPGYFSTSPSQQMRNTTSSNTTPNTPSSIPDIILTAPDFSESEDLVAKSAQLGYSKDLCMSGSFDTDFFPSDESLREGLDPIDLDGLQMLTDPELIADPATEDHFRLDRL
ncbi:hypothetical protein M8J76_007651 [Diaphorina citri]|nr:hypothetical protein M8J76_007651 [Diaphorina citri]